MQAILNHTTLAHYLAAVGVIGLAEIGSVWEQGVCRFGTDLPDLLSGIESARVERRLLPLKHTDHPLWCNRGRRSLVRGVTEAREWLAKLTPEQRAAELAHLLTGETEAIQMQLPHGPMNANPSWNLGTLHPGVITTDSNPPALVSAWLPVLAWEAQRLILTLASRAAKDALPAGDIQERMADSAAVLNGDIYAWIAHEWGEPLSIAEVFLLLNGGTSRWHYAGRALSCMRQPYFLRDTSGGGKTAEFCRADTGRMVGLIGLIATPEANE